MNNDIARALCLFTCILLTAASQVCSAAGIEAITRPSEDVTLSFVTAGRISRVLVKDGDTVKAGQLLVELDDEAERVQVEQLKAQAGDETRVQAADARLEQKRVELKRLEEAERPALEVDRAKLDVTLAELALRLAKFELEQSRLRYQEARIQLDRMRLTSTFDGKVEKLFLKPGESADRLQPVIRIVRIDPLRLDVPVPREEALAVKVGQVAQVQFREQDVPAVIGKVTFIAAEADAASDTLTVRVEAPNPASRPAGEHVYVRFALPENP